MGGIFKAYDIRGIYGEALTDEIATGIGRAFVDFLGCKRIVIGRDMRVHSPAMFAALAKGVTMQGTDVIDIGLVSTPMCYYANGSLGADGSIMITASHNPGEWNGMKMCREAAIPISGPTGIEAIEQILSENRLAPPAARPGLISTHAIGECYRRHIQSFAKLARPLRIAVDYANAVGIIEAQALDGLFETRALFDTLDGSFPNHEANPLDHETLEPLQHLIRTEGPFDFGIAFDGDADRVGFVDEHGEIVPMDLVTALIAQTILKQQSGRIFYDLRSSKAVREAIEEGGGEAMMSRVGHAFIKRQMRDADALFAGELSGHYYFRENYFTESSALAVLFIANLVSSGRQSLSELIAPLRRYSASGEINSKVADVAGVFRRLRAAYPEAKVTELDGLTLENEGWWFNVRASNTEPLVRLNLEACDAASMQGYRDQVLALIRG